MHKYTMDELNNKSIFEIRNIAREVGIPSPTKKNKDELMQNIFKISNGEINAPTAPKRGRPKRFENQSDAGLDVVQSGANSKGDTNNFSGSQFAESDQKKSSDVELLKQKKNQKFYDRDESNDRRSNRPAQQFRSGALSESRNDNAVADQVREGFLEINPDGYGFLRVKTGEFSEMDAYISSLKIKQHNLRRGDFVKSMCKHVQDGRPAAVVSVLEVDGIPASKLGKRPNFDDLIPIYPNERIRLEQLSKPREYATRCIDLVAPIGKGQRAIIVSPPKAGKTTLLKMIASSISENYPDVELMVLLIDERPEEVTDMQRSIKGEVTFSTFDELPEHHTKTAELLLDRAKRKVEMGKDVVILLDSLTRLARAYNLTIPPTGRTLSGGIDPGALHSPKRFFGSARNLENGGSLTIIATALVDTGSRMDEVIYEEFKGTGNMEIHLDRKLSEKRVFPAIDLAKSGTRKEELLLSPTELEGTWGVRKMLSSGDTIEATENLLSMLIKTSSNKEFVQQLGFMFKQWQKEGYTFRKMV